MIKKILVIDNNPVIVRLLVNLLTKEGYEVRSTEDGLTGLMALNDFRPDAIFVDLVMPNIDGATFCRVVRTMPDMNGVRLIIVSGLAAEEGLDPADYGADACIAKGAATNLAQSIRQTLATLEQGAEPGLAHRILGLDHTCQRQITKELLASKRHTDLILGNISDAIVEISQTGRVIYANPAALSMAGVPEEKLLATSFVDLFSGSDRKRVRGLFAAIGEGPASIGEEAPVRLRGRHLVLWALPVCIEETTILVIARDITRRWQTEQALRASHAELDQIFNTAADGMAVINNRFTILRANQTLLNQLGITEEVVGRKCHEVLPGPLCNTAECPLVRISGGEERIELEAKKLHADGTPLSFIITTTAFRGPNGELKGIVEDFKDITYRKKAESALKESEERYRDLFENTTDLIQNVAPDGRILYVNPAWRRELGYGSDEISRLNIFDIIHPEERQRCRQILRRIIAGEKIDAIETAFLAKDGRKALVAGNASCKYVGSEAAYTRGIFHDITARKEMEERLKTMALTDELTGAYNRRMFDDILSKQMNRAARLGEPLSLIMLDIDHFKRINDAFGHNAGDEVLKSFSALLRKNIREMDYFVRWGGEEFVLLLPATPDEAGRRFAERLRRIVATHDFGQPGPVTISLGVTRYLEGEGQEAFLGRADEALYAAKRTGRDKAVYVPRPR